MAITTRSSTSVKPPRGRIDFAIAKTHCKEGMVNCRIGFGNHHRNVWRSVISNDSPQPERATVVITLGRSSDSSRRNRSLPSHQTQYLAMALRSRRSIPLVVASGIVRSAHLDRATYSGGAVPELHRSSLFAPMTQKPWRATKRCSRRSRRSATQSTPSQSSRWAVFWEDAPYKIAFGASDEVPRSPRRRAGLHPHGATSRCKPLRHARSNRARVAPPRPGRATRSGRRSP